MEQFFQEIKANKTIIPVKLLGLGFGLLVLVGIVVLLEVVVAVVEIVFFVMLLLVVVIEWVRKSFQITSVLTLYMIGSFGIPLLKRCEILWKWFLEEGRFHEGAVLNFLAWLMKVKTERRQQCNTYNEKPLCLKETISPTCSFGIFKRLDSIGAEKTFLFGLWRIRRVKSERSRQLQ